MKDADYRPTLHFTPAFGWMNDPNGLIYHADEYHLFYQYHPFSSQWGPMHWGHAISKNLIDWTHYPIALKPDEQGMCFSGTAVADKTNSSGLFTHPDGLLAFFTLAGQKKPTDPDYPQSQGMAFSHDNGRTWEKYAGNPVIPNPGLQDFRDPKVFWYEPYACWIMVVTLGQCVGFYRSDNAVDWIYLSSFGEDDGKHDERAWECPDLFPLLCEETQQVLWILIVSIQRKGFHADSGGVQYFVGHFDGHSFTNIHAPDVTKWLDFGKDFYACQSWANMPAKDDRRIALGWMNAWPYGGETPLAGWRSAMNFPRELRLHKTDDGFEIRQSFIRELDNQLTERSGSFAEALLNESLMIPVSLPYRFIVRIKTEEESMLSIQLTDDVTLRVAQKQGKQTLNIMRSRTHQSTFFDRHFPCTYEFSLLGNNPLDLDVLVDSCSIELLINQGEKAFSFLSFPEKHLKQIELKSEQGMTRILQAKLYL